MPNSLGWGDRLKGGGISMGSPPFLRRMPPASLSLSPFFSPPGVTAFSTLPTEPLVPHQLHSKQARSYSQSYRPTGSHRTAGHIVSPLGLKWDGKLNQSNSTCTPSVSDLWQEGSDMQGDKTSLGPKRSLSPSLRWHAPCTQGCWSRGAHSSSLFANRPITLQLQLPVASAR